MNKYLRAVGFTKIPSRKEIYKIIEEGIKKPVYRAYTTNDDDEDTLLAQFEIGLGDKIGLCVCGQFDEEDRFYPDYYYPYLDSDIISSKEELSVEPRVDNDTYAGICDDLKVGAALIFRLRNAVEYIKRCHMSFVPLVNTTLTLTALSLEGTILLPIKQTKEEREKKQEINAKRRSILSAAKEGDENAMKDLTIGDMDVYSNLVTHLQYEDVYSVVESSFIPYGSECELYSIMGEIMEMREGINTITGDKIYIFQVNCNEIPIDVVINREDLFGEPQVGRRFKGIIWLQGKINFPVKTEFPEIPIKWPEDHEEPKDHKEDENSN